jgi:hypothetical protein
MLFDELQFLFDGRDHNHQAISPYEFTSELKSSLVSSLNLITARLDLVKEVSAKVEADFVVSYANSIFYTELNDYRTLFKKLKHLTSNLIECVNGLKIIDNKLALFCEMVNSYHCESEKKLNYFDMIESVARASSELTQYVLGLFEVENSHVKLQIVEPSMFFSPKRMLKKLLFDKSHRVVKLANERNKSGKSMELELSPPLTPRLNTERRYLLEVF